MSNRTLPHFLGTIIVFKEKHRGSHSRIAHVEWAEVEEAILNFLEFERERVRSNFRRFGVERFGAIPVSATSGDSSDGTK